MVLYPASGTGQYFKTSAKIIRLHRHGCTNRPFYQIVVTEVQNHYICILIFILQHYCKLIKYTLFWRILLTSSTFFCCSLDRSCWVKTDITHNMIRIGKRLELLSYGDGHNFTEAIP